MGNVLVEGGKYCVPLRYPSYKRGGEKTLYMCGEAVKDPRGRVLFYFEGKYDKVPEGYTLITSMKKLTGIWAFARKLVGSDDLRQFEIRAIP